jgi:hypothetical protein
MIAAAALLAACSPTSTTAPPVGSVAGTWSGSITDALLGSGTLSLSLAQAGDSVTGTWSTKYADTTRDIGGVVAGTYTGTTLAVLLRPENPPTCQFGPFEVTASVTAAALSGTYTTVQCAEGDGGTLTATMQ